jgi:Polyketide cyclase / dehydrase and lipid transport
MLKIVGIVVAVIVVGIAGILALAATKPDTFRVQRAASIKAPPEKIFPFLNDLHNFASWSPYEKKDPAMKRTHSGAPSGKGAVYEWDGDKNVGAGRLAIANASPPSKVTLNLDMFRPLEAHNMVVFTLEPKGESTNVTWAMDGKVPYIAKIVHVFLNVDKMVGQDFEAGLANLKTVAEK